MRTAEFLEEAEAELREAAAFYGTASPGLREAFLDEVERVMELALDFPALGTPFEAGTRRLLLSRFPFGLIYRERSAEVLEVVAIMHLRREPGYWRDRM